MLVRPLFGLPLPLALVASAAAGMPLQIDPVPRNLLTRVSLVAALDLDGDGQTELIGPSTDRILRAYHTDDNGRLIDATELAPRSPLTGIAEFPMAMGDVDGDGLVDMVGLRSNINFMALEVIVWFDRGGERFEAPIVITTFDNMDVEYSVLPDDFDGDGDLDFVLYPTSAWDPFLTAAPQVQVVMNLGGGNYGSATSVQSSNEGFFGARPADLDQDGDLDFVAIRAASGALAILRGVGGVLQVEAVPGSLTTISLEVGDINLDGRTDVVAYSQQQQQGVGDIDRYLGSAAGALQPPVNVQSGVTGASFRLALADVNGDAALDLLLLEQAGNVETPKPINVYAGDGVGDFGPPVASSEAPGRPTTKPMVGDFNGDGQDDTWAYYVDPSTAPFGPQSLVRIASPGTVSFQDPAYTSAETFVGPVALADFDSDEVLDLVTTVQVTVPGTPVSWEVYWAKGSIDSSHFESSSAVGISGVAVGAWDLDGSGPGGLGIVVRGLAQAPGLFFVQANSNGQFQAPLFLAPDVFVSSIKTPRAVDWDGDGDLDLVGRGADGSSLVWLEQTAPLTFPASGAVLSQVTAPVFGAEYSIADFNGDGHLDVVTWSSSFFLNSLAWRQGLGGGVLGAEQPLVDNKPRVQVADVNDDGFDDVVWMSPVEGLRLIPGGPGGLAAGAGQVLVPAPVASGFLARADFDGDLDLDVVILGLDSRRVQGYANLGGGSYAATPVLVGLDHPPGVGGGWSSLVVADLGGDGDLDIVGDDGFLLRNESNGVRGDSYCGPAAPNSTGQPGRIVTLGSTEVAQGTLQLRALDLPRLSFGYFITSQTASAPTAVPASSGFICVGGAVGRYSIPSQIQFSGLGGQFALDLNLSQMPTPNGLIQALPGSTWNFQAWFRDSSPVGATSNFTDAVGVDFQ